MIAREAILRADMKRALVVEPPNELSAMAGMSYTVIFS